VKQLARRLWAPLLVVALAHFAFSEGRRAFGASDAREARAPGGLMVAAGGSMQELAIQFHRSGAEIFLDVYRQLFAELDPDTRVQVIVGDEEDERVFEAARQGWLEEGDSGPHVRYLAVGRPITSWARDRFAVLDSVEGGPLTILAPPAPMVGAEERANDWLVPWALSEHLGPIARLERASFQFEGGDLIADDAHAYVATPLFERNPYKSAERILRELSVTLGRRVVRLGREGHPAPSHHIGMFVTPLGEGVVLYGDPALGLDLLGERTVLPVGGIALKIDRSAESRAPFVEAHEALANAGLHTIALPLLVSDQSHIWLSYNNVLMERRHGRLHIYMPSYGVPDFDARAQQIYESLGAVVHPIDVSHLFRLGGTVRCLVAPLRRAS